MAIKIKLKAKPTILLLSVKQISNSCGLKKKSVKVVEKPTQIYLHLLANLQIPVYEAVSYKKQWNEIGETVYWKRNVSVWFLIYPSSWDKDKEELLRNDSLKQHQHYCRIASTNPERIQRICIPVAIIHWTSAPFEAQNFKHSVIFDFPRLCSILLGLAYVDFARLWLRKYSAPSSDITSERQSRVKRRWWMILDPINANICM